MVAVTHINLHPPCLREIKAEIIIELDQQKLCHKVLQANMYRYVHKGNILHAYIHEYKCNMELEEITPQNLPVMNNFSSEKNQKSYYRYKIFKVNVLYI